MEKAMHTQPNYDKNLPLIQLNEGQNWTVFFKQAVELYNHIEVALLYREYTAESLSNLLRQQISLHVFIKTAAYHLYPEWLEQNKELMNGLVDILKAFVQQIFHKDYGKVAFEKSIIPAQDASSAVLSYMVTAGRLVKNFVTIDMGLFEHLIKKFIENHFKDYFAEKFPIYERPAKQALETAITAANKARNVLQLQIERSLQQSSRQLSALLEEHGSELEPKELEELREVLDLISPKVTANDEESSITPFLNVTLSGKEKICRRRLTDSHHELGSGEVRADRLSEDCPDEPAALE